MSDELERLLDERATAMTSEKPTVLLGAIQMPPEHFVVSFLDGTATINYVHRHVPHEASRILAMLRGVVTSDLVEDEHKWLSMLLDGTSTLSSIRHCAPRLGARLDEALAHLRIQFNESP